jgi:hypothetical protein
MGLDSLVFFFFSDVITTIYLIGREVLSYGHFNSCWFDHIFTPNLFGVIGYPTLDFFFLVCLFVFPFFLLFFS